LRRGDVVLLCSDGLSGPLSAADIGRGVPATGLQPALAELAAVAETRAGAQGDNISVVALAFQEDAQPDYLSLSDDDIEREIEKLKQAFREQVAAAPVEYLTDEEIAREIERIRRAFRLQWALYAGS
jgi:hypothetical protein